MLKIFRFFMKWLNRLVLQWLFLRLAIKLNDKEKLEGIGFLIGVWYRSGYMTDYKGIFKGKYLELFLQWNIK